MQAVALLMQLEKEGSSPATGAEARHLLETIAADDFSTVAQSPPLIYQNDSTGTVKRYYWSRNIGFALWLRLYFASLPAPSLACAGSDAECRAHE